MKDSDLPFWRHIEALRRVLWYNVLTLAVAFIPAFLCAGWAISRYVGWMMPPELRQLHYFTPLEVLFAELKVGFLLALGLGFPLILRQWWGFIAPALYRHERRKAAGFVISGYCLFLAGAAFALGAVMPLVMNFAASYSGEHLTPVLRLSEVLSLGFGLALAFGLTFQVPLAVMVLGRAGIIDPDALRRRRPVVIVAILIVAAVLTPPDVVSQVLLALPTLLLFELGLILAGKGGKKTEPEAAAAGPAEAPPEPPDDAGLAFYSRAGRARKGRRIRGFRR